MSVRSPLLDVPGAVADAQRPTIAGHYGEPAAEQRRLEGGTALVDLSDTAVIAVDGPDRLSWLDSMTSQRLIGLAPGGSAETLLLDPSGRIEHAAAVLDDGATAWLLVDADRAAALATFLDRMRFMLRVTVVDRTPEFAAIGSFGAMPPHVHEQAGVPLVWHDPWRFGAPGGTTSAVGAHPGESWDFRLALIARDELGALAGLPLAGVLALEALRIAAWRPAIGREVDERSIPHELDWLRSAVHLDKGCYRGQETVAKVHNLGRPPRRLVQLDLDGSESLVVKPGDAVTTADGERVGTVTSAANHYEYGPIALAIVKRRAPAEPDLAVVTDDGAVAAAQRQIVPADREPAVAVPHLPRLGR